MSREEKKKQIFSENLPGQRLKFVRDSLGLKIADIVRGTGIPRATYADMENGIRSKFYEDIQELALFYNKKWQESFIKGKPLFKGEQVVNISLNWIMLGIDPFGESQEKAKIQRMQFFKREYNLINRIKQLEGS